MTDERYKKIMEDLGYPQSQSIKVALEQVANEVAQEWSKKNDEEIALLEEKQSVAIGQITKLTTEVDTLKAEVDTLKAEVALSESKTKTHITKIRTYDREVKLIDDIMSGDGDIDDIRAYIDDPTYPPAARALRVCDLVELESKYNLGCLEDY
jgi:hypothetical protein